MEGVINYCWIWCFNALLLLLFCFHFHLFLHRCFPPHWKWSALLPLPLNPRQVSLSPGLLLLILTRPPLSVSLSLSLSAGTPGSKVSCLTVNVLSFPQREAARRQRENYSVLHSINLHCVTHTHQPTRTHTHMLTDGHVCSPVSLCLVEHIASPSVWVCEDMRGHRASQQF